MARIKVKLDGRIIEKSLQNRLSAVNNSTTMLAMHNTLAKRCDPYVPFLNGPLSQTVQVTPEHVRYIQPYAHYQYYGVDFNHTTDYHPLASAMWDKAMLRDHRAEFFHEIKDIIERRLLESNG